MAKKRMNPFASPFDNPFSRMGEPLMDDEIASTPIDETELQELLPLVANLSGEEGMMTMTFMSHLADSGVTPDQYASFYNMYHKLKPAVMARHAQRNSSSAKGKKKSTKKSAMKDKTLLLKIQMKGVTKPPMWREVEIPADMTFIDLHDVIQEVTGLDDYHLWQFNERAYDDSVLIGNRSTGDFDMGLDYVTDDADSTPVSAYLAKEGDKLEYVYDFGDDWIFTVTVKKVLDKKSEHPVCTAFKSELNALEDSGGPWNYENIRQDFLDWDTYDEKRKESIAEEWGDETPEEYYDFLKSNLFDIDKVNESLKDM